MKALFHRILSLALVLAFLVSGTGLVLATHTCLASSRKSVALFVNTGCCKEHTNSCPRTPEKQSIGHSCCITDFLYHKIDVSSTATTSVTHFTSFISVVSSRIFCASLQQRYSLLHSTIRRAECRQYVTDFCLFPGLKTGKYFCILPV